MFAALVTALALGQIQVPGTTTVNATISLDGGLSVGSVTIDGGSVAVTSLPSLPAGSNQVGSVFVDGGVNLQVTALPPIQGWTVIDGGVTANQGSPNTAANSWTVEQTDGTNVLGTSSHPTRTDPTGTTTQPVSAASLPLPSGASTSAKQPALGTAGSASADVLSVQGIASMTPLKTDGSGVTQPVSATALPLPTGAATAAKQPALGTAGSASADVISVQGVTSMTPLKTDGSGVTQPVSGTVGSTQSGTWNVNPDSTTTGSAGALGALNNTVSVTNGGIPWGTIAVQLVAGTSPVLTVTFEGSVDGTVWNARACRSSDTASTLLTTTSTFPGEWRCNVAGMSQFRVRVSAYTSGSTTANLRATSGPGQAIGLVAIDQTTSGTTNGVDVLDRSARLLGVLSAGTNLIGYVKMTDGTNFMPTMDVAARKGFFSLTDGTNTMPTMDAVGRPGFFKLTDGTNTAPTMDAAARKAFVAWTDGTNTAAVKAASTAAAATDPSGVVAFSPNSPLPTGTNTIGAVTQASGPWSQNITQFGGSAVATGTGAGGTGIPRVTVSNDSQVKPWDGTNTVTVKAASTAPATTDTSLVVTENPLAADTCTSFLAISQTASTDILTSTNKLHICAVTLVSDTAQKVSIIEGTGTTCATSGTAILGSTTAANGMSFGANGGVAMASGKPFLKTKTTADHLCVTQSSTGLVSGFISYVDQ